MDSAEKKEASWLEVSLVVDNEVAEAVAEVLSRYAPNGVVVEREADQTNDQDTEIKLGPCHVSAYLDMNDQIEATRQKVEEALYYLGTISKIPEPTFTYIKNQNWMESWKKFYNPVLIGKKIIILPAWIPQKDDSRIAIKIDPSMAFGTGTHPTTQLCLEAIEHTIIPGEDVIDVGCGSGILSICALLLGAKHALGVDIEEESIRNSLENASRNGVAEKLELHQGSVKEIKAGQFSISQAHLVTVNIIAPILISLFADGLSDLIAPEGKIILSGILEDQEQNVRNAAESNGLIYCERNQIKDWVSLIYQKKAAAI